MSTSNIFILRIATVAVYKHILSVLTAPWEWFRVPFAVKFMLTNQTKCKRETKIKNKKVHPMALCILCSNTVGIYFLKKKNRCRPRHCEK